MIIRCPSCNTRFDFPSSRFDADGTMIKCSVCAHSWLEGRAIEVTHEFAKPLPAMIEQRFEPDLEIRRLVDATRDAQEAFAVKRRRRHRIAAAWAGLFFALSSPFAAALALPETAVRLAPATAKAYEWAGWNVNIYGLDIRKVETQHLNADGTTVIAVKGEISNVSSSPRKIPWLRFGLRDDSGAEVYSWQLDTNARPLLPGESTSFVTRIASPPAGTGHLQIRFARIDEIGSTALP